MRMYVCNVCMHVCMYVRTQSVHIHNPNTHVYISFFVLLVQLWPDEGVVPASFARRFTVAEQLRPGRAPDCHKQGAHVDEGFDEVYL